MSGINQLTACGGENGNAPQAGKIGRESFSRPDRAPAGSVSPEGTDPAPFLAYPWIEGEGPHRLQGVPWDAIADGRAL